MISTGSRNLIYIRSGSTIPGETMKREYGFSDYCKSKGVHCDSLNLGDESETTEERILKYEKKIYDFIADNIKSGKFLYDGIYVSTDWLALIILEQMKKFGIKVPEETQVIGHDGLRQVNQKVYLLSTIVQPVKEMAEKSVELILKKIKGEEIDLLTMLPVEFADGGTTR